MARTENTVFICYARPDTTWARAIYQDLTAHSFDVFFDYASISNGDFEQIILGNIRARAHFLLILTPGVFDHISEPDDWLRREIETAIDEKRNIVPLFIDGFNFGSSGVAEKLTGKLAALPRYNGLAIPADYFDEAMEKLRNRFLTIPLDTVIHPVSTEGWKLVKEDQVAVKEAPKQQKDDTEEFVKPARKATQSRATRSKSRPLESPLNAPIPSRRIGQYEIKSEIGRGGFGTVYLGFDPAFNREVAIKVLPPEFARSDSQFTIRFEREGKNIVLLKHPAIVPVHALGEQDDQFYIVMGYMPGGNLRGRMRQKRFSLQETIQILGPIASGLDYAHTHGFVHRDLKPGNILFDRENSPCVSDIIDSRLFQGAGASGNAVFGTPVYMAPEEAQGDPVDGRTHIYSLGVILFEMLAGRPPYEADTPMAVMIKHISEPVPDIRKINPDLPDIVQTVIEKAMAKKREERFRTAVEMIDALRVLSPNDLGPKNPPDEALEQEADTTTVVTEETEAERAIRLQAAIAANLLANNRSQAVFNDKAQGEDQLGIKDEVEALAETLLLRDVEPPVAVGVMGGWGSGKSFVMYLIHQYVQATRAKSIKKGWADGDENDPKIPAFVGHVYQINFNAWTYAKSNLWASLMDTIFSCLNRQMQLERLLAHRNFSPEDEAPTKEQIKASMLAGGDEFRKIFLDNPQFGQDKDLGRWRANLDYWSHHLLKGTLLWNVMRGQQVETLEKLKDTEEQLIQLKTRREQFEKERPLNEITTNSLRDETARHAYFQSIKSFMLAFLSDQLSTSAKEELKKQDVKEEDVQKFLEEAKGISGGVKTLVTAFRQSKLYLIWTVIFLILFFAVPFVWSRFALDFVQPQIARVISLILTLLPALRVGVPWIKKSIEASLEARKILEGAYATQQAKRAEKISNATDKPIPQKISELQAEISNGSLPAYDALIGLLEAQAEEQRQKIGPSAKYSNLMEFVQSRLDAATYENQLGLMHQVRQDIDELTYSLVDNASPEYFPRGKPRVILYIDDLDRCPPWRVVEVLEAVQLLLNTKLFIVILGLDTRYVTRALEKEYKEILQHEGDPSGLDYIEKIIQIPYRVRSIEANNLRKYIEKQMDIEKVIEQMKPDAPLAQREPESVQTGLPAQSQPSHEIEPSSEQVVAEAIQGATDNERDQRREASPEGSLEPGTQKSELPVETKVQEPQLSEEPKQPESELPLEPETKEIEIPEIELPAAVIQFKQEDLDDLAACCQKIALTPRSIKRLVNVFKLMKIFWFRADKNAGIAERDRPRPVKQAAICLLALSSAYPEVMREVFVQLETLYRQGQEQSDLFTALNTIVLPPGSANELAWQLKKYKGDLVALKTINGHGQEKFGQLTLQNLKLSTFNIVRSFSFVGDPVYWTDGEEDTSQANGKSQVQAATGVKRARKKPLSGTQV